MWVLGNVLANPTLRMGRRDYRIFSTGRGLFCVRDSAAICGELFIRLNKGSNICTSHSKPLSLSLISVY